MRDMAWSADCAQRLDELLSSLTQPSALIELAVLVGCLVARLGAWCAWCAAATQPEGSIWFGERIVDGVLFPVLALAARRIGATLSLLATFKPVRCSASRCRS